MSTTDAPEAEPSPASAPQAPGALDAGSSTPGRARSRIEHATSEGWRSYVRPGVLVIGVLLIQLGFIAAYVGAWHAPTPKAVPVAIVAPVTGAQQAAANKLSSRLTKDSPDAIQTKRYPNRTAALEAVRNQKTYAAVVPMTKGSGYELHLASAGGGAVAEDLAHLYGKAALLSGVDVQVYDDVPLPASDSRGIAPFYLVVGWVVGGYLVSTLLSLRFGAAPLRVRANVRILALMAYALASGAFGTVIVGPVLGVWHDNLFTLATVGVLTVFGAAVSAAALGALFGAVGTGLTIVLLVVLGNPGSGGPFSPELLPGPFRGLHEWLLTGGATQAVRSIVYFGGHGATRGYVTLLIWCVAGVALYYLALAIGVRRRLTAQKDPERAILFG
jgi:hypothetical protein